MPDLDNRTEIEKFDKGKILASIRLLPDQMEQAWEKVKKIDTPKSCSAAENVVIAGMGGSALGGRIIDSLEVDHVRVPIEVFTQYDLPHYVNEKTLVIVNSYSGNTEEAVSMARQAIKKKAKTIAIASGGKLKEIIQENNLPLYIIDPRANPSGQPRMGLGFYIAAIIAVLSKCGFVHLSDDEFYNLVVAGREIVKSYDSDVRSIDNPAKKFAKYLQEKAAILVASGHLVGVAHAFKNQINETSKTFSALFDLPELNHHLLEGLAHPQKAKGMFHFVLFDSDLYHVRIQKRVKLTAEIIDKNGHEYSIFKPKSKNKLEQVFETLIFGSFVTFYLAILNGADPIAIPWVDYLKEELAKA